MLIYLNKNLKLLHFYRKAFKAFLDYQMNSIHLSRQAMNCLKRKLQGEKVSFEKSDMSKREWNEFLEHFPEME